MDQIIAVTKGCSHSLILELRSIATLSSQSFSIIKISKIFFKLGNLTHFPWKVNKLNKYNFLKYKKGGMLINSNTPIFKCWNYNTYFNNYKTIINICYSLTLPNLWIIIFTSFYYTLKYKSGHCYRGMTGTSCFSRRLWVCQESRPLHRIRGIERWGLTPLRKQAT